jgi:hypothetical protein
MITKDERKELQKALKALQTWASLHTWELKLQFAGMEGKFGTAEIQDQYRQAVIVLNPDANYTTGFKHDTCMQTLCHEFAHIWLWDVHHPELYNSNWAYTKLVEQTVEDIGRVLYLRVLKPLGY